MPPKEPAAISSNCTTTSKRAQVDDTAPKPTKKIGHSSFPRDSPTNQKWITGRAQLKIIVKKSFDEYVVEHLQLTTFIVNMGWEPLFNLSGDYYTNLVCKCYATRLHKTNKTL